ncbi:hypothetical protein ON010_g14242 [Phytophthora cinnamomi]|nr:hypothetical protein ON010_g14242 [Phytophthora cinnamomi]
MCNLLHSYTHLGRTAYSRHRDFAELCAQSKADFTLQILLRETEGMDFSGPPSIVTHTVPSIQMDSKIVTTVSAFAFDYLSLKTTFIAACDAILGRGTEWPQYSLESLDSVVLDKPQGNVTYAKSGAKYRRSTATTGSAEYLQVESRSLVFYRMTDSYGVLMWDFADQDDLYPVNPASTIKRDIVGGYGCGQFAVN